MTKQTNLIKLKRISPSRFTALNKCALSVVFSNSLDRPLLPYPHSSYFGNIAHKIYNLMYTEKIISVTEFDHYWEIIENEEEKSIINEGFGFLLPLRDNVRGYTLKKLLIKKSLNNNLDKKSDDSRHDHKYKRYSEKWLESKDKLIGGFADLIENYKNSVKISDFKTGNLLDENGELKRDYEEQIKLYAYLYNQENNVYPNYLSVIDMNGNESMVEFTPEQCELLASQAKQFLDEVNNSIEENAPQILAKPTIENCGNCRNKPACKYFWDVEFDSTSLPFCNIYGKLESKRKFKNGKISITLEKSSENLIISHLPEEKEPLIDSLINKNIALYNVFATENKNIFRAIKTTVIYEKNWHEN